MDTGIRRRVWVVPLLVILVYNLAVYEGSRILAANRIHFSMESSLDGQIPLLPWMVTVYLGCYLFWTVNYILAVRSDPVSRRRFITAELLGKTVCLVCFLLIPTTMTRPILAGGGIWEQALKLVYSLDAADNLFPSIHCFVSWMCVVGLRGQKRIPEWYRKLSVILALAVCVSTVTVKQHVLADVAAGVLLAEICHYIAGILAGENGIKNQKTA